MSYAEWLTLLQAAEKASVISGRCRKFHYKLPNGHEMVEEYSLDTGVLLRRAWKRNKELRGEAVWDIEVGDSIPDVAVADDGAFLMRESNTEPFLTKRVTKQNIEWRIRNLPYPLETYQVTVNDNDRSIVVRTTNKKFFKSIKVLELDRCNEPIDQRKLTIAHQHSTLIISYKKPEIVTDMEKTVLKMLQDVVTTSDLDVDCNTLLKELLA